MIVSMSKTKQLVYRRSNPRLTSNVCVIPGVESVCAAKLLGVIFKDILKTDSQVSQNLQPALIFAEATW